MSPDLPNVSRETIEQLKAYEALLKKWNPTINLVARSTIKDLWHRHIVDSAQIFNLAETPVEHWVDLGSGGGFPGLVVAIMAKNAGKPAKTTLVESDIRKATFLRAVIRELNLPAVVVNDRIERIPSLKADILSARALADLSSLLEFAERHLSPEGTALFMKGESWKKELEDASRTWRFSHEIVKSQTEQGPVILRISGVARV